MYFWNLKPITAAINMDIEPKAEASFLQKLMLSPDYHIFRHTLLIIILSVISLNQTLIYFSQEVPVMGIYIFLIAGAYLTTYLITGYFLIYYLIPRFLLKQRYGKFFTYFLLSVLVTITIQTGYESYAKIESGTKIIIGFPWFVECISQYLLIGLCFAGISLTVLLRSWLAENQRINILEQESIQSEMEQLKEQVSPMLLFNILNRTGVLALKEPATASSMLIKLSQLLRYQLYDCNRDKVLISSEITFLTNYLTLEQLYSGKFTYEIIPEGDVNRSLVAPLLFIPFIQTMVHKIYAKEEVAKLTIHFKSIDDEIIFSCISTVKEKVEANEWRQVKRRLELLYPNHHTIHLEKGKTELKIKQMK